MALCSDSDSANQEPRTYVVVKLLSGLWNKLDMRTGVHTDGLTDDDLISALGEECYVEECEGSKKEGRQATVMRRKLYTMVDFSVIVLNFAPFISSLAGSGCQA
jgi:hypothetical protein